MQKNSKKFPFDYSLYLKEIYFEEIQALIIWCSKFNLTKMSVSITCLAVAHCPNLTTLSLSIYSLYLVPFSINEGWTLPHLQNLSLPLHFDNSISSTLSRIVHNLESISVEDLGYAFFNFAKQELLALPHPGLQKLIQSPHQLKAIIVMGIITKMSSLFKLLESQSNSLESIVLEDIYLYPDDLITESLKFHQLTSICVKKSYISKEGLKSIIDADLPKLQHLKFENTGLYESDWILLQNKYLNQVVHSGNLF